MSLLFVPATSPIVRAAKQRALRLESPVSAEPYARKLATVGVGREPLQLAVNEASSLVYVHNGTHGDLSVFDAAANRPAATVRIGKPLGPIAVSPLGNKLYVGLSPNVVLALNALTLQLIRTIELKGEPRQIVIHPRTDLVYIAAGDRSLAVLDGRSDRIKAALSVPHGVGPFVLNPRTNRLYAAGNRLSVVSGTLDRVLAAIDIGHQPQVSGIAINAATNRIYLANSYNGHRSAIFAIDGRTHRILRVIPMDGVSGIAVDERINRVYAGCSGKISAQLAVIDGQSNQIVEQVATTQSSADSVVADSRSHLVFVSSEADGIVSGVDGVRNRLFASIPVGMSRRQPVGLAMNRRSGKLYASNFHAHTVTVIQTGHLPQP